jgi:hypothetical protein
MTEETKERLPLLLSVLNFYPSIADVKESRNLLARGENRSLADQ